MIESAPSAHAVLSFGKLWDLVPRRVARKRKRNGKQGLPRFAFSPGRSTSRNGSRRASCVFFAAFYPFDAFANGCAGCRLIRRRRVTDRSCLRMIATPRPTAASRVRHSARARHAARFVVRLHRSGRSLGKCLHTRWVRCSSSQCAAAASCSSSSQCSSE